MGKNNNSPLHSFEWAVDEAGYDLVGKNLVRRRGKLVTYSPDASELPPHIIFHKLRYLVLEPEEAEPKSKSIIRTPTDVLSGVTNAKDILWKRRFQSLDLALLAFVSKYGFLVTKQSGENPDFESIDFLTEQQSSMSVFYAFGVGSPEDAKAFNDRVPGHFTLHMTSEGQRFSKSLMPLNLLAWMWNRIGDDMAEGVEWKECEHCGKFMVTGGKGRKNYRLGAKYCSNYCRVMFSQARSVRKGKK